MPPSYRGNRLTSPTRRGRHIAKCAKRALFPQLYASGQDQSRAIEPPLLPPAADGWTVQLKRPPGNCDILVERGHSVGASSAAERVFAMATATKPNSVNPPAATNCVSAFGLKYCSLSHLARTNLLREQVHPLRSVGLTVRRTLFPLKHVAFPSTHKVHHVVSGLLLTSYTMRLL